MVRVGGPERRMLDFFLLRVGCWCCGCWLLARPVVLRLSKDFLCARVRDLRSVARREAVISAEGGSPKMKNLMKAAIKRTIEIWPRMNPCVKVNEYVGSGLVGHTSCDIVNGKNWPSPLLLYSCHIMTAFFLFLDRVEIASVVEQ